MRLLGWTDVDGDPIDVYARGGGIVFRRRPTQPEPDHQITGGWLGGLLNPARDAPSERRSWFW